MRLILYCFVTFSLLCIATVAADLEQGTQNGIFYEVKGAGRDAIVFIHGGQLDRRIWDEQWESRATDDRCIRYDIRGFGKSAAPISPYSDREDLRGLLDHLGAAKATLVGFSLGAAIALDFALEYPARVSSLVLVCPGLGGFPFKDKANDLRPVVDAARDESYDKAAELWLSNPYMAVAMDSSGRHAFDLFNDDETSRMIIRKTFDFLKKSLHTRIPSRDHSGVD
jgi:pimeloyl-ACP methyl ester carboxylesterase